MSPAWSAWSAAEKQPVRPAWSADLATMSYNGITGGSKFLHRSCHTVILKIYLVWKVKTVQIIDVHSAHICTALTSVAFSFAWLGTRSSQLLDQTHICDIYIYINNGLVNHDDSNKCSHENIAVIFSTRWCPPQLFIALLFYIPDYLDMYVYTYIYIYVIMCIYIYAIFTRSSLVK